MKCSSCESDLKEGEIFWCSPCQESYLRSKENNDVKKIMDKLNSGIFGKNVNLYDIGDIIEFKDRRGIVLDIDENFYTIKFNNGKIETLNYNVLRKSSREILLEYLKEMNYIIECKSVLDSLTELIERIRTIYGKKINSGVDLVDYCFDENFDKGN